MPASTLCTRCQKIPLDPELKTLTASDYDGPIDWYLGAFGDVRRRNCPFCQLLASICYRYRTSWGPFVRPDDSERIHVQYRDGSFHPTGHSPLGFSVCLAGKLAEGWPRCIRDEFPRWIDFDDVRRWLKNCEEKHGSEEYGCPCTPMTFDPAILPRGGKRQLDFRVIDVQSMCIAYAKRRCRYVALSYVWGRPNEDRLVLTSHNEESLTRPGALDDARDSIPACILDSITAVRNLGERYLWVDALCLLQDDPNELQTCVAVMDLFYEMAVLTIIAACGEDAYSGLQGVPPTPRKLNVVIKAIQPGLDMTTKVDVEVLLRRSNYSTRAWTMQEEILSRRRLVFINGQVYYSCYYSYFSEALNWPGRPLINEMTTVGSLYSAIYAGDTANFSDYGTFLTYYMSRKLSIQSDVLRAAQGILRKHTLLTGIHCFEGLPAPLDRSLLFQKSRQPISYAYGRRDGFPSYSWTGWKSASKYDHELEGEDAVSNDRAVDEDSSSRISNLRGWITWHCKLEDGNHYRIDNSGRLRKAPLPSAAAGISKGRQAFRQISAVVSDIDLGSSRPSSFPLLLFWTICVNLELVQSAQDEHYPVGLVNYQAIDKHGSSCGIVMVDMIIPSLTRGNLALIAVNDDEFWALLVMWTDGGIAERRGLARLPTDVLTRCLDPGPRWKAIVLG